MTTPGRVALQKLASQSPQLKQEVRHTLARSYFKTDMVVANRQEGVMKYKHSYNNLAQLYNKMKPNLVRHDLTRYLYQLGPLETPKTVLHGRTKYYEGDEQPAVQQTKTPTMIPVQDDEEKAPTLDQL